MTGTNTKDMALGVVILNYNDIMHTRAQVERILPYESVKRIIIVDNASTDKSAEALEHLLPLWNQRELLGRPMTTDLWEAFRKNHVPKTFQRVQLLRARVNGGYGRGNNLGLRHAVAQGMSHILICNPDTSFSEECLQDMLQVFSQEVHCEIRGGHGDPDFLLRRAEGKRPKQAKNASLTEQAETEQKQAVLFRKGGGSRLGVVSCRMIDRQRGLQQTAWPLRGFYGELLSTCPLLRRVFWRKLYYAPSYFEEKKGRSGYGETLPTVEVGAVHGSLFMISAQAFTESGGFDENVFLYGEENILAYRLRRAGFRTKLLLSRSYFHEDGGSTGRAYSRMLPKQKLRQKAERYYYKQYLHISDRQEKLTALLHTIVLWETRALDAYHSLQVRLAGRKKS